MARRIQPIKPDQTFCSPRQAAKALGISEYLIYHEIERIPHRQLGKRLLIPVEWVKGTGMGSGKNGGSS